PLPLTGGGKVIDRAHAFAGGVTVRVVGEKPFILDAQQRYDVEVVPTGKAKPRTVVRGAVFVKFFPSPDGKLLAVRWAEDFEVRYNPSRGKQSGILVLDARGNTVAEINAGD